MFRVVSAIAYGDQCIGTCCPAGRNYRQLAIGNASRNYRRARLLIGLGIKPDGFTFNVGITLGSSGTTIVFAAKTHTFILKTHV